MTHSTAAAGQRNTDNTAAGQTTTLTGCSTSTVAHTHTHLKGGDGHSVSIWPMQRGNEDRRGECESQATDSSSSSSSSRVKERGGRGEQSNTQHCR